MPSTPDHPAPRRSLFLIFTLSGFAGLIYESIWTHYLKLLLGHAAYAQTLVLVLFMGGLALGAGLCGRWSVRIADPLRAYAVVELALGGLALAFDPLFRLASDALLLDIAPALGSPLAVDVVKWTLAALLILPACVLLGATFPLMSAAVVRLAPARAGQSLGWLYFGNSLGAVIGVLASGFLLIGLVGLPGTLRVAAGCNLGLAAVVLLLARRSGAAAPMTAAPTLSAATAALPVGVRLLLLVAALTGTSSFLYEIAWLRMLSLVLGSATHSFELMLAAFILGLALGALAIRNHLDRSRDPLRLLAWVQLAMGTAALLTLGLYRHSFDAMAWMVGRLPASDLGYVAHTLLSQALCIAMMLPVTVFAGMTLPLITALLLRSGQGEAAIGRVYAANTWGAIAGVVLAAQLLLPLLGLRNVVIAGAAIDLALGALLLRRSATPLSARAVGVLSVVAVLALLIPLAWHFDPLRMASGVFRYGQPTVDAELVWHADGRTASIDVLRWPASAHLEIRTNGKPDASLKADRTTSDDYVQIYTGALPLALHPAAREVAVVGFGSGRSTHTFLAVPSLDRVDTIEIEPAMVEGSRLFGASVARAYDDPRSRIRIEDARTFFARHQQRYDVIMSEPSNPWVSGVSGLFTHEFYRQIKRHLKPDGLFVQWLQVYEFDDALIASVLRAMDREFADYAIHMADDGNLLIAAVASGTVPGPDASVLRHPALATLAAGIGIDDDADYAIRHLASRAVLADWLAAWAVPANSDFHPYLDQHAARFRYLNRRATELTAAHPVLARLSVLPAAATARVNPVSTLRQARRAAEARALVQAYGGAEVAVGYRDQFAHAEGLRALARHCDEALLRERIEGVLDTIVANQGPYLDRTETRRLVDGLRASRCTGVAGERLERWLALIEAGSQRDWPALEAAAETLARSQQQDGVPVSAVVAREWLLAAYARQGRPGLDRVLGQLGPIDLDEPSIRYFRRIAGRLRD